MKRHSSFNRKKATGDKTAHEAAASRGLHRSHTTRAKGTAAVPKDGSGGHTGRRQGGSPEKTQRPQTHGTPPCRNRSHSDPRYNKEREKSAETAKKQEARKEDETTQGIRRRSSFHGVKPAGRTVVRATINGFTRSCANMDKWRERPLSPNGEKEVTRMIEHLSSDKSVKLAAQVQHK